MASFTLLKRFVLSLEWCECPEPYVCHKSCTWLFLVTENVNRHNYGSEYSHLRQVEEGPVDAEGYVDGN